MIMALRRLTAAVALSALVTTACSNDGGDPATEPPAERAVVSEAPVTVTTPVTVTAPATVTTPAPVTASVVELVVVGGDLIGGSRQESVSLGEEVTVRVTGTSTDRVHVHGYDLFVDLVDGAGDLTFMAVIPGIFEIELEDSGTLLVRLEVK